MNQFNSRWLKLQERLQEQTREEEGKYLPNRGPSGPVDHILVAIEPSLAFGEGALQWNFLHSMGDFLLHYAIREYLCSPGETYHLTDLCKVAMHVKAAAAGRNERYRRWYPLLKEEIDVVSKPSAMIWPIGRKVSDFLEKQQREGNGIPRRTVPPILHYSAQAGAARWKKVGGRNSRAFQEWKDTAGVSVSSVRRIADIVLGEHGVPEPDRADTLKRISRVSDSSLALLYHYREHFQKVRTQAVR